MFELPEIPIGLYCTFSFLLVFFLLSDVPINWAVVLYTVFTLADCGGGAVLAALQVLKGAGGAGPEHSQGHCWNKTWLMSLLAVSRPEDEVVTCFGCCCWGCVEAVHLFRDFSAQK